MHACAPWDCGGACEGEGLGRVGGLRVPCHCHFFRVFSLSSYRLRGGGSAAAGREGSMHLIVIPPAPSKSRYQNSCAGLGTELAWLTVQDVEK